MKVTVRGSACKFIATLGGGNSLMTHNTNADGIDDPAK